MIYGCKHTKFHGFKYNSIHTHYTHIERALEGNCRYSFLLLVLFSVFLSPYFFLYPLFVEASYKFGNILHTKKPYACMSIKNEVSFRARKKGQKTSRYTNEENRKKKNKNKKKTSRWRTKETTTTTTTASRATTRKIYTKFLRTCTCALLRCSGSHRVPAIFYCNFWFITRKKEQ